MLTIETLPLRDLVPYAANAKKHPPRQVEQIKQSIQQFGNNDPIAIDEDNVIIEGHGRLLALQQLGRDKADVIRISGLTEQQKKAYRLIHNQLTLNTGFDPDILRREIEAIQTIDLGAFDLDIDTTLDDTPEEEPDEEDAGDGMVKFCLNLDEEQFDELERVTDYIEAAVPDKALHKLGNPNKRANLIFEVVYQWAAQKTLL